MDHLTATPKATRFTRSMKSSMIGGDQKPKAVSMDLLSSKTPEKSMQLRGRNRGVALSIKDVKRVANGLRDSDSVRSTTKRQLLSSPDGKLKSKSKAVDAHESGSRSKLPEKYEMLCETFHSLDCVVRLMRMKGVTPAFSNVRRKVEQLTERRFAYEQLAQMKYVLPEAIVLKKVSELDEATSCMKYDIHVGFELDAIKSDGKGKGGRVQLSKVFRSRLLDFFKSHSEDTEIPEGPLPEPFGRPSKELPPSTYDPANSPLALTADPAADHPLEDNVRASHISGSFRKCFSQKFGSNAVATSHALHHLQTSEVSSSKSRLSICTFKEEVDVHAISTQMEDSAEGPQDDPSAKTPALGPSSSSLQVTPRKQSTSVDKDHYIERTPSKFGTVPASPMTATPVPLTPKRSLMSPDDDHSHKTSNKLVRRALRTRSLKFDTPANEDEGESNRVNLASCSTIDRELADTLDDDLLQSILEKERKANEESDPAISQAKRRRDMIAGLPKLFNMVHFYFRSIKRSVVTKDELIHSMIASHSDFLDKREVEEQLKLLQEIAPEYISDTITLSGDNLIRVNKTSNADSIRARLSEAT